MVAIRRAELYIKVRIQSFDREVAAVAAETEKRLDRCSFSGRRTDADYASGREPEEIGKTSCGEEIKKQLQIQRKRYPLMTEEDVVKFVFQGMLGVGHLISSVDGARSRLAAEMASLEPDESEPLIEKNIPPASRWVVGAASRQGWDRSFGDRAAPRHYPL